MAATIIYQIECRLVSPHRGVIRRLVTSHAAQFAALIAPYGCYGCCLVGAAVWPRFILRRMGEAQPIKQMLTAGVAASSQRGALAMASISSNNSGRQMSASR